MKKVMNYLAPAVLIAAGAMFTSPALAQTTMVPNNLYLGFENQANSGTADYIINLGPASAITNGSAVVTLSSDFSISKFNSVLNGSDSMYGGVVGGSAAGNPSTVFGTQLRVGGPGTPSLPGSTAPGALSRSQDGTCYNQALSNVKGPTAGTGVLDTTLSWESSVEPTYTTASFYSAAGFNPDSPIGAGGILYEDLWFTASSTITGTQPFNYLGYFTLDLSGSSPKLTFTPASAVGSLTAPVIQSISKVSGTVTVSWSTVATHTYQLQYSTSLSPTNWTSIGSSQLAGGTLMTNTDSTFGTNSTRFYRVMGQ